MNKKMKNTSKIKKMHCLMCNEDVDMKTLKCKGCKLTFKVRDEDSIVVDYDSEDTKKVLEQYV